MTAFFIIAAFLLGFAGGAYLWPRLGSGSRHKAPAPGKGQLPYERVDRVLDKDLAQLHGQLVWACGEDMTIMPRLRLAEMVAVPRHERKDFYINLAASRAVDFLLCDPKTTAPLLAVTVRDGEDETDEVTRDILRTARIARLGLKAGKVYPPTELKNAIRQILAKQAKDNVLGDTADQVELRARSA